MSNIIDKTSHEFERDIQDLRYNNKRANDKIELLKGVIDDDILLSFQDLISEVDYFLEAHVDKQNENP